jgi:hypothetical protein
MDTRPEPSRFASWMQDLSLRAGDDLHRALEEATALLAHLAKRVPARARRGDVATMSRAQRELSLLVARELARLCSLAAEAGAADPLDAAPRAGEPLPAATLPAASLADLLHEELDCAEALAPALVPRAAGPECAGCLPAPLLGRLRDLTRRLAAGERDAPAFRNAGATIEALASGRGD